MSDPIKNSNVPVCQPTSAETAGFLKGKKNLGQIAQAVNTRAGVQEAKAGYSTENKQFKLNSVVSGGSRLVKVKTETLDLQACQRRVQSSQESAGMINAAKKLESFAQNIKHAQEIQQNQLAQHAPKIQQTILNGSSRR